MGPNHDMTATEIHSSSAIFLISSVSRLLVSIKTQIRPLGVGWLSSLEHSRGCSGSGQRGVLFGSWRWLIVLMVLFKPFLFELDRIDLSCSPSHLPLCVLLSTVEHWSLSLRKGKEVRWTMRYCHFGWSFISSIVFVLCEVESSLIKRFIGDGSPLSRQRSCSGDMNRRLWSTKHSTRIGPRKQNEVLQHGRFRSNAFT